MARLAPEVFKQFFDSNGDPLSGGKIYTYEAGTTTNKATYTDDTEGTANANPIILDSEGRADIWLDSGSYKFVIKTSADVTIDTVDNITGDAVNAFGSVITTVTEATAITSAYENNLILANGTFSLSLLAAATAEEGFVFVVKNTGSGTITIDPNGSETIDGASTLNLTAGQWAIVDSDGTNWQTLDNTTTAFLAKNNTFTAGQTIDGTADEIQLKVQGHSTQTSDIFVAEKSDGTDIFQVQNDGVKSSFKNVWSKGADLASATTLVIGDDGNFFDVTGTTTITGITVDAGMLFMLQFDGALTLTDGASLTLPSNANIATAAGDTAICFATAANTVTVLSYNKTDGTAVVGGGFGDKLYLVTYEVTGTNDGGTATSGSWGTRPLNTEAVSEITGASLSTNVISLPAGDYIALIDGVFTTVNACQNRLYDTSNTATLVAGSREVSSAGTVSIRSSGIDKFTLAGTTNIELQYRVQTTSSTDGLGSANSQDFSESNKYASVAIWKVG